MQLTDQQEEFSYAYVHAVATLAGYGVDRASRVVDNGGIDLTISAIGDRHLKREPSLHVQTKCTYRDVLRDDHLAYPLETKHHHQLCKEVTTARILVVVFIPNNLAHWLFHSEEELILRHCGYWLSLSGQTPTSNQVSQTVHIPRSQRFDPPGLVDIMTQIDVGQPL